MLLLLLSIGVWNKLSLYAGILYVLWVFVSYINAEREKSQWEEVEEGRRKKKEKKFEKRLEKIKFKKTHHIDFYPLIFIINTPTHTDTY